jgi:hypothetical protein
VDELKRVLRSYAWRIGVRELLRCRRIPGQARLTGIVGAGCLMSPFVVGSAIWWLLTGKPLPGRLGHWFPPPTKVTVDPFRGRASSEMRELFEQLKKPDAAASSTSGRG